MPHILRCDHHHVCWMLRFNNRCKNDGQPKPVCMFDTRLHSNASDRDICGKCMEEFPRSNLTVYDTVDGNPWPDDILLCPDCAK